ncbi:BTAD domain-containing putative transcriptional regulator [Geodermatophilus sp. SYSU D01036]
MARDAEPVDLQVRILGPLQVLRDGRVVRLGGLRPQAILALLTVHAGRVVPQEQLIEEGWNGRPPRTAPAVLRTYIAQLRAAMEPTGARRPDDAAEATGSEQWHVLLTQGPGYLLQISGGQVDAQRFGELAGAGRRALAEGAPGQAADLLGEALALWRGPALMGLADLGALRGHAHRLNEDRWQAVEDRIEADLACGRHASLVGELHALVEAEPLRERLTGQLMLALYRCGRQVSALSVYQSLRGRLTDEMGVVPGADLQRLQQAILRHDPQFQAAHTPVVRPQVPPARRSQPDATQLSPRGAAGVEPRTGRDPTPATSGEWQLLGRRAEMCRLEELLASGGSGVVVVGPPGVGKSRLCAEFVRRRSEAGQPTIRLSATSSGREIPLGCMAHLVSSAGPGRETSLVQGDLLHATVSSIIARTTGPERLIIFLDDAHLADPATITVLDQVVRASNAFLLATERWQDRDPLVDLWKNRVIERIDLDPLSDADVSQLLDAALGGPSEARTRSRILRLASGSPLYLRELLAGALSSGALQRHAGEWTFGREFRPSDRLLDIVGERLRGLAPGEADALEAVATAEPVPLEVLERVAAPEAILGLEVHGLVRVEEGADAVLVLPAHPIYGEVVRARLPRLRRRHVSAGLARAFTDSPLAEGFAVQHAVLCLDGGVAASRSLLELGARRAQAGGDHRLALRLAQAALDAGAGTRAALIAAETAAALGQTDIVGGFYRQAAQWAVSDEDDAGIVISQARGRLYDNDAPSAFQLIERAHQRLSATSSGPALRVASAELKGFTGEWADARDLALALQSSDVPVDIAFAADCIAAFAASFAGTHATALAATRRARQALTVGPIPQPQFLQWLELATYQVRAFDGGIDQAVRDAAAHAERSAAGIEHPDWAGVWSFGAADFACLTGSVTAETRKLAEQAVRLLRRRDVSNVYSLAVSVAALTAAMAGDTAEGDRWLEHYDRDLRASEQKSTALADRARAWLLLRASGPDAAARHAIRAAAQVIRHVPLYAAPLLHDAVRFGRPDDAVAGLQDAAGRLDAPVSTAMAHHGLAALDRDVDRLHAVAREFTRLGARQLAAEALMAADALAPAAGHDDEIAALTMEEIVVAPHRTER